MIFLKRKRLVFWLLRAYLKKWGKTILISFTLGIVFILFIFLNKNFLVSKISFSNTTSIGIAGIYSRQDIPNNLPEIVQAKASRGLTKISEEGQVMPDLAEKWEIKDDGKTFVFYLKDNLYFSDGSALDSSSISYNFSDVTIERPAKKVIVFKLRDKYSPFLVTLANHRVFKKNYIGISPYRIKKVKTNGGFIDFIELYSKKDNKTIKYDFYDTQEALKSAYVLGEVTEIIDINDTFYKDSANLIDFKNSNFSKNINYSKIVTVFFNNSDPFLSDKKIRKALAYSLPDAYKEGERAYAPYRKEYWFSNNEEKYQKDLEYAKLLLSQSDASVSGKLKIDLKTLPQYKSLALDISKNWKPLNIETKIEVVDGVPSFYQAFLGELPVLKDPDQYTLWHTAQSSNITNYKNLRIDKLLEDGRRTYKTDERKKIYSDFQKYLVDDMPAVFLFFPYTYTLTRK